MIQLLSPERIAIASTQPTQDDVEGRVKAIVCGGDRQSFQYPSPCREDPEYSPFYQQPDTAQETPAEAIAPPSFDNSVLAGFRQGYREHASSTAEKTLAATAESTASILQMAGWIASMRSRLSRKEFSAFVKGLLQWSGKEARKYLDIARVFEGFDLDRLTRLEPFTLLAMRSKRYAPVVEKLREQSVITPKLVQDLIGELLPKQPRKKASVPISGWKPCPKGGGRYYNVLLHNEEVGLSIEKQAQSEGILPHQVIESAIALRAEYNEKHSGEYVTVEREELNMVVTQARTLGGENRKLTRQLQQQERRIAQLEAQGREPSSVVEDELASESGDRNSDLQDHFASRSPEQVQASVPLAPAGHEEAAKAATEWKAKEEDLYQHPVAEKESLPFDRVSDSKQRSARGNRNVEQSDRHIEQEESPNSYETQAVATGALDAGSDDNSSTHQLAQVTQNVLSAIRTLRDFEAHVRTIDAQIQDFRSKLASGNFDRQQEWHFLDALANRQKLRATKIANMLTLAHDNAIRASYEQLSTSGRIVLERDLAASLLENACTWSEVELIVGSDRHQLTAAVKDWQLEQRQILVRLLSAYLETSPSALDNIAWIPKKLIYKALSALSFKVRIIGGPDNLMDEPTIEYETCSFVSLEHPGTRREQWIFNSRDNKLYPVFGREGFEVERF